MPATPVTPYLDLLRAVLNQAREDGFGEPEPLQLALWLVYRVIELDFRCIEAYLFLAYLFCLLQDWPRACQILLHADKLQPGHAGLQAMLTQIRFSLQHPLPAAAPGLSAGLNPGLSKGPHKHTGLPAVSQAPLQLPRYDTLRQQLEVDFPPAAELEQRLDALGPILQSLARSLKERS